MLEAFLQGHAPNAILAEWQMVSDAGGLKAGISESGM